MEIVALFCDVDDFCQQFEPWWQQPLLTGGERHRRREGTLCLSEGMTIEIAFHQSGYRTFKTYDTHSVTTFPRWAFAALVSYSRFVGLLQDALDDIRNALVGALYRHGPDKVAQRELHLQIARHTAFDRSAAHY